MKAKLAKNPITNALSRIESSKYLYKTFVFFCHGLWINRHINYNTVRTIICLYKNLFSFPVIIFFVCHCVIVVYNVDIEWLNNNNKKSKQT